MSAGGYIYILTNPAFEEYVKIGYADNVEQRMKQLNKSEAVPFAFRIYATYRVSQRLKDKEAHKIIDVLNRDLRSRDIVDGKLREREFFKISPEEAYSIFEAMAEIHGCHDCLKKYTATKEEEEEEKKAQDNRVEERKRRSPFTFSMVDIPIDAELECPDVEHDGAITVCDDRHVLYQGKKWAMTTLVHHLLKKEFTGAGTEYFKYEGEWLNERRQRMEQQS